MHSPKQRIRQDVRIGDFVIQNRGGWYIPIIVVSPPIGKIISVYRNGKVIPLEPCDSTATGKMVREKLA